MSGSSTDRAASELPPRERIVAITGGARGIGLATARALTTRGARVAIGDLDGALAEQAAAEVGPRCVGFTLDVTDTASFTGFLSAVEAHLGPLDVLVNNAGVLLVSLCAEEADADTDRMLDVNLRGTIRGTRLALARMLPRGCGHIVNVSSLAGKAAFPGAATYSATKYGIVGFSEAVRVEVQSAGIELSCVMPVLVQTGMAAGLQVPKGVPVITPETVAAAIVRTIERPRFDVFVPRGAGAAISATRLLPRSIREALGRLAKADQPLRADTAARAEYVARVG